MIIDDCESQLQIELIKQNPRNWTTMSNTVPCVDRGSSTAPVVDFSNTGVNNDLLMLRACVRIDPMLPTTGLGAAIVENNSGTEAGGSYALVRLVTDVIFEKVSRG
jgi:hypothetical protein